MRKLVLDPESLSVQSFATHDVAGNIGGTAAEAIMPPTNISDCRTFCACPNTQ